MDYSLRPQDGSKLLTLSHKQLQLKENKRNYARTQELK
jgi:hypothetical protein